MSNDDSAVQVVVRVRPLNRKEVQEGCEDCSNTTTTSIRLQAAGTNFNFDRVFDPRVSQAEIYESSAKGIVQKCFNGYNGTIFAYGQTGSGKTFSMGTDFTTSAPAAAGGGGGEGDLPKTSGIIPRAVHEIFHTMTTSEDVDFKLTVSYLEVYKEEIKVHPVVLHALARLLVFACLLCSFSSDGGHHELALRLKTVALADRACCCKPGP